MYNREGFIADALDSAIAQDYHDWDILVVDDGSTDGSVEVVKSRMSDDRITLIQMKHGGCAAATAIGIEHARGPVITSLDSDDKLMPDSLSAVLPAFECNPHLGYVWTNWVDSTGGKGTGNYLPAGRSLLDALMSGWWEASHQRFFRKNFYMNTRRLDVLIKYAVDFQLALLIAKTGCDTLHIPKVTYWYRIHTHKMGQEHHDEQVESIRLLKKRELRGGNTALTELYIVKIEEEIDALRSELTGIKNCFGYKFMRRYSSIIEQALPDGTRRGELKRRALDILRGQS